jgi:hypothetical protein
MKQWLSLFGKLKKGTQTRRELIAELIDYGHLTGIIFDVSDSPTCAKTMGIDGSQYSFEQVTMKMREEYKNKAKDRHRPIIERNLPESYSCQRKYAWQGQHASWLTGKDADPASPLGSIEALNDNFCGCMTLFWSERVGVDDVPWNFTQDTLYLPVKKLTEDRVRLLRPLVFGKRNILMISAIYQIMLSVIHLLYTKYIVLTEAAC